MHTFELTKTSTLARAYPERKQPFFAPAIIQPKLTINQPGDQYEQEADAMAERVMRMSEPAVQRKCAACEEEEKVQRMEMEEEPSQTMPLMRKAADGGYTATPQLHSQLNNSKGGGSPLPGQTLASMNQAFGADFSSVRIHTDAPAAEMSQGIQAKAFTHGSDIYFNRGQYSPESSEGRRLLGHELTHVVQQGDTIRRRISPEDVSGELAGQTMEVTTSFNSGSFIVTAGSSVIIIQWQNASDTANVKLPFPSVHANQPFNIPKILLRPSANTSGLARYRSGIESTAGEIDRGERRIAQEQGRRGGPRPGEIPRLQGLQRNRRKTLNRRIIQEVMFNRFDGSIKAWVDHYNHVFRSSNFGNLDPNDVKSMLFQESEVGTSGQFMSLNPPNREMGIHNLAQVIDSSASALLIMMTELEPALITTYHLQNIRQDTTRRPAGVLAEDFMWSYVASGQTQGFQDAVNDFYTLPGGVSRDTSYDFWIQTAVRWLFEKRKTVKSWSEAIRAYNGSGPRAIRYRDAVQSRSRDARTAASHGRDFIPQR
jgi:hypothetical protein